MSATVRIAPVTEIAPQEPGVDKLPPEFFKVDESIGC
jgi:hypothetical protein